MKASQTNLIGLPGGEHLAKQFRTDDVNRRLATLVSVGDLHFP